MGIYTLLTHLFPSISFKKDVIEVEFPETHVIPELHELGEFTYNTFDKGLQNEIAIPFWTNFKIDPADETSEFELLFHSDDKKINQLQMEAYKSIANYSTDKWQNVLGKIWTYYQKHYSNPEYFDNRKIETIEDLKRSLKLNQLSIHKSGNVSMSFDCIWDEEHGLGVRIDKNNEVTVGEAPEQIINK